jgi:hypothetical protein
MRMHEQNHRAAPLSPKHTDVRTLTTRRRVLFFGLHVGVPF